MMLTIRGLYLAFTACILVGMSLGCVDRPIGIPEKNKQVETPNYFPQSLEKDVDILFVIDNSNSMQEEQDNLRANFPKFIEALRTPKLDNKIPNIRIGIVSSDLGAGQYTSLPSCEVVGGDGGRLQSNPVGGCTPPKNPWIEYTYDNGKEVTNINSNEPNKIKQVADAFQCIAQLGVGGCGYEHQLEAAYKALDPKQNINPGFLRKDAFLAVVFLTDEDDCSASNPQLFDPSSQGMNDPLGPLTSFRCFEFGVQCDGNLKRNQTGPRTNCAPGGKFLFNADRYVEFFKSLKPAGRVIVFAIAGPTDRVEVGIGSEGNPQLKPSCQTGNGKADPAIRIKAVVDAFQKQGHFNEGTDQSLSQKVPVNICSEDFSPALRLLGRLIVATLGGQCITSPPLTRGGGIACHQGDDLGNGKTCPKNCLDMADCIVTEITEMGLGTKTSVEKCAKAKFDNPSDTKCNPCPCWRVVPKSNCKASVDGAPYGLEVLREGDVAKGTVAEVKCATSPYPWGSANFSSTKICE